MKIPAAALRNVLSARGLSAATLAKRAGVPSASVRHALEADADLEDEYIESIADQLAVPVQALFAREALPLFPPVDFRTASPGLGEFSQGTLKAISFVEKISSTLASLGADLQLDSSLRRISVNYTDKEAVELARAWRTRWGITDSEQMEWQDANKLYVSLRSYVESLGVLVIHRSFDTDEAAGVYAHIDAGPHVILINTTKSSKARKLFTLAHEFCHVLLRAEGASNPSIISNKVERFCNRFAACLLAPKRLIETALRTFGYTPSADESFIRLFAKRLGISQECLFLRLVEIGYLDQTQYAMWKAKFSGRTPAGDTGDGGGGRSDPLQTKRTTYGATLLGLLERAKLRGQLDEIDIYRLCGLKPKYQDQLFAAV